MTDRPAGHPTGHGAGHAAGQPRSDDGPHPQSPPARYPRRRRDPAAQLIPALPAAAAAAAGGMLLAAALGGPWPLTAALALAAAAAWWGWTPPPDRGWPLALALGAVVIAASAGHARMAAAHNTPAHPLEALAAAGLEHDLVGVVRGDPVRSGTLLRLDLYIESVDARPAGGGVRLTLPATDAPPEAGDRLRLRTELQPLPELAEFDYAGYLRRRGIHAVAAFPPQWQVVGHDADGALTGALRTLREGLIDRIERTYPEPEASLAAGMLLGARRALPPDLEDDLRRSGTSHLVVVSGQNIAMVLGVVVSALGAWIPRRRAALVGLGVLPCYVLLVGADPPVVRAALMAVALVIVQASGRRTPGWIALAYAACGMLLLDPLLALDAAFQLSLAATAGIMALAEPLTAALRRAAAERPLATPSASPSPGVAALLEVAAISTAAALAVLPVQAALFGEVSPWQIPANVVVAPLYEATLLSAAAAATVGGVAPLAEVVGVLGRGAPALFAMAARWFAALPGSSWSIGAPVPVALGWWAALAALAYALPRWRALHAPGPPHDGPDGVATRPDDVLDGMGAAVGGVGRLRGGTVGGARGVGPTTWLLGAAAVVLWGAALTSPADHATVTVLDVGQGLAVLIEDRGAAVLIDAGPPDGAALQALGRAGVRGALDAVVLTHGDLDHRGGLAELERRYRVGAVLDGEAQRGERFDIGDRLHIGGRTTVEVLAPPIEARPDRTPSENDRSLVLRVTIGDRRLLITGDIERSGEDWLVRSGHDLRADVLVVPHHGSATSSGEALLRAVDPTVAIISVGRNAYGHPHPDVLRRLSAPPLAAEVRRTDEHGDIAVHSDGTRLWLEQGRG